MTCCDPPRPAAAESFGRRWPCHERMERACFHDFATTQADRPAPMSASVSTAVEPDTGRVPPHWRGAAVGLAVGLVFLGLLFHQEVVAAVQPWIALAALPLAVVWLAAERLGIMEGRQLVAMTVAETLFLGVLGWRLWWAA